MKEALEAPRFASIDRVGQEVRLSFQTMPLARYVVQWTSELRTGSWSDLVIVPGDGDPVTVNDVFAAGETFRYYRLRTPPAPP
jgi:hypothetical protein